MQEHYHTNDQRWQALTTRDPKAIGHFLYGVVTTRVVCLPGCKSRLPLKKNVRFFVNIKDAEHAGFRACKRCHPNRPDRRTPIDRAVKHALELLDTRNPAPDLATLGQRVGVSPFHLQRHFKRILGISPKEYVMTKKHQIFKNNLADHRSVTKAIFSAGYGSTSGIYAKRKKGLGMTPSQYAKQGAGRHIRYTLADSPLGKVLVAATEQGVCAIELGASADELINDLKKRFARAHIVHDSTKLTSWVNKTLAFIERPAKNLDLPLDLIGTAFQHQVWKALQSIPFGQTLSYGELAKRLGNPKAVRAVARACGQNPVSLAVPCHRVIAADGALTGYRWGVARKQALLKAEAQRAQLASKKKKPT